MTATKNCLDSEKFKRVLRRLSNLGDGDTGPDPLNPMQNIPVIGKFLALMAMFAIFAISCIVYTTTQMALIQKGYETEENGPAAYAMAGVRSNGSSSTMRASILALVVATTEAQRKQATKRYTDARKRFDGFAQQYVSSAGEDAPRARELAERVVDTVDHACANTIALGEAAKTSADSLAAQDAFNKECLPPFQPIADAFIERNKVSVAKTETLKTDLAAKTHATIWITYVLMLGGLGLVIGIGVYGVRVGLVGPLNGLVVVMNRLARGDYQAQVDGAERRDEIGAMYRALEVLKAAGRDKERLEAETAAERNLTDQERRQNEQARALAAKAQAEVVNAVGAGLEQLAKGDLTFRLHESFTAEYEKLRTNFNLAMSQLQDTMKMVVGRAAGLHAGGVEIAQASDGLSKRTEQQAASLEETAAALDQITATVKKTAEGALHARNVVSEATAETEKSGQVVKDAVGAMTGIEESARHISQIIGVIDEIAFQTNLLALNAGVEAARAGDAGRGFAVVASEVRALAQRSAEAAKEIKALISTSTDQVAQGVELVDETGRALERIAAYVAQINSVVAAIAGSAQEQATGLHQVNTAVNQMDQMTQQNAAMVEQATAASHNLREEAEGLASLMDQFQIGATATAKSQPSRAMTPAARRPSVSSAVRPKIAAVSGGRSAPAPDASWEEF
jgi:methyl-accepting chemotaxis protein